MLIWWIYICLAYSISNIESISVEERRVLNSVLENVKNDAINFWKGNHQFSDSFNFGTTSNQTISSPTSPVTPLTLPRTTTTSAPEVPTEATPKTPLLPPTQETSTTILAAPEIENTTSETDLLVYNTTTPDVTSFSLQNLVNSPFIFIFFALWLISAVYLLIYCIRKKKNELNSEKVKLLPFPPYFDRKTCFYLHERIDELEYNSSYEIDRNCVKFGDFIAKGHFGEVYDGTLLVDQCFKEVPLEEDITRTSLSVAIKVSGNAEDPEGIALRKKLLDDELKLMCSVGFHPNVVTLIGAVTENTSEGIWILMEKCTTGNLSNFLKSRKNNFIPQFDIANRVSINNSEHDYISADRPKVKAVYRRLTERENWKPDLSEDITTAHLLSFAMQIALGMDYLASIKCIHRDLAARNILLTHEGSVKIADFGLAKRIGYSEYYRSQSSHDLPYRWMSVESLKIKKYSIESDIWSYGILLYEIFTLGGLPYPNISNYDLYDRILTGSRNSQPQYCPNDIYHHMTLCWAVETNQRPSFRRLSELMKCHLSNASKEVLKEAENEFRRVWDQQQQLLILRSKSQKQINFEV